MGRRPDARKKKHEAAPGNRPERAFADVLSKGTRGRVAFHSQV